MSAPQASWTDAFFAARARVLAERTPAGAGNWVGELSSSAVATATAAFALASADRDRLADLIHKAIAWLLDHQNADGGWGDTPNSPSNLSATLLCWASITSTTAPNDKRALDAASRAQRWIESKAGSVEPDAIATALRQRYGQDRTFAVPILSMCALAGRLGPAKTAWRIVPQLPFELAAVPHRLLRFARLPVVSYALPALVAIGQTRHHFRPTWNPIARLARNALRRHTLALVEAMQPASGGFLEAAPLTSFVIMHLCAIGQRACPVVARGVKFLADTVRPDGSWPIDTNLSIWTTTLSIKALAVGGQLDDALSADERRRLLDWLLGLQYRTEHPFTHAAPGGWAWTDLPGGVPDADDTAGALLAIRELWQADDAGARDRVLAAVCAGARWLADLQNSDGGIPTFCRGWGRMPFDRSGADLTAHAIEAWRTWRADLPAPLAGRVSRSIARAQAYLARVQRPDGSWLPLWFGDQAHPHEENAVHGSARVLRATNDPKALAWLLDRQNPDGSWGHSATIEQTAMAVEAIAAVGPADGRTREARDAALRWLVAHTAGGTTFPAAPIGLYFARLWYCERLYPLIFTVAAMRP